MTKKLSDPKNEPARDFYVVGIGASAGGLDALQVLFDNIPSNTGMAFVIVQHLSPNFKSMMDELLSKHTKMPIFLAENNIELKPNCIYLNPKEKNIICKSGKIVHQDKDPNLSLNLPIDLFFHSLGNDIEEKSIGIILSGTGTDGSRGISTIKGAGGTIIVQDPDSAQFDGMPVTAINSDMAEFILPPENIGEVLMKITVNYPFSISKTESHGKHEDHYLNILDIIYKIKGIDFNLYKPPTLFRRIEKRITITQCKDLKEYYYLFKSNEEEQQLLVKDFLIGVTGFFRDKEAYEELQKNVITKLFKDRTSNSVIRIWVAACSTGEEAYSIAIILDQYIKQNNLNTNFKIFATDVGEESIRIAAKGCYPVNHITDIPADILERYFIKTGDFFEIEKRIREKIVFSKHNILKDPPFIKMDLITCRNLLIYFLPKVQQKLISTFQFSLFKNGYLFLGHSENIADSQKKYFKTIDSTWRIFQNVSDFKQLPSRMQTDFRMRDYTTGKANTDYLFSGTNTYEKSKPDVEYIKKIAGEFAPACVLIDRNYNIVYVHGNMNDYLRIVPGTQNYNLLDMLVDKKLSAMIRNGYRRINEEDKKIIFNKIAYKNEEKTLSVNITFEKKFNTDGKDIVLISFNQSKKVKKEAVVYDQYKLDEFSKQRIEDLENELKRAKQQLQNTIEELETSNEELQASNEELQASNEELQSTNEELQSVNEELYTVNAEMLEKNNDLINLNYDINNILDSTEIATLLLDKELRIRKFTPALKEHFNLNNDDLGRPISTFAANFTEKIRKSIISDSEKVYKIKKTIEKEISDEKGNHFLKRISPFFTGKNEVEGVVISLINITQLKQKELELLVSENKFKALYNHSPDMYVSVSPINYNVLFCNDTLLQKTGYKREEVVNHPVFKLFDKSLLQKAKEIYKEFITKGVIENEDLIINTKKNAKIDISLSARAVKGVDGEILYSLSSWRDVTDIKKAQEKIRDGERKYKLIFEEINEGFAHAKIIKDNQGNQIDWEYIDVNPAFEAQTGLKRENVIDRRISEILPGIKKDVTNWIGKYSNVAINGKDKYMEEYSGPLKKWFAIHVFSPRKDEFAATFTDITERKEAELKIRNQTAQLIQSEKMNVIGTLTAGVAHELNNPIMGILNYAAYCKKNIKDEKKVLPVLKDLMEEAERISEIIKSLLSFTRKEELKSTEKFKTNILKGLNDCLKLLNLKIKNENIVMKLPDNTMLVNCNVNPSYLQQLLFNLVDNAIHAVEGAVKKEISITIKENAKFNTLTIKDTGIGIPTKNIDQIYNPFFTTKPVGKGTGLGLSICKNIVEEIGGSLSIQSAAGKGTTCKLVLPKSE